MTSSVQSASEHCRVLLGACLPDRGDLLDVLLRHVAEPHFPDPVLQAMFVMTRRYVEVTGAVMTRGALEDMVRAANVDEGRVLLYLETYDALAARQVQDSDFRWSLQVVRELAAERATAEALTQSMEVLTRGLEVDGAELRGHADARAHLMRRLAEVDRQLAMEDSPEGDMRQEGPEILLDYAERKRLRATGRSLGILTGLPELDARTGGLQRGELDLVVGYAGDGKTSMCCHLAWHACVQQGLNVVFLTTETLRPQVRRRIIARHSMVPEFGLLPDGVNSKDLKEGTLNELIEGRWTEIVDDFTRNPSYGHLYVSQVPRGATVATLETRLQRIARMWDVDLVVMDYLALLKSERRRSEERQELVSIVKDAKVLAASFADGRGVCLVSPWQVSRQAYESAMKDGHYTLSALSDTTEAEKSADVVVSLLNTGTDVQARHAQLRLQILKNRDGERASSIMVDVDYATSHVQEQRRTTAADFLTV